jgi:deoxyribodipyrimidine photo-lyase
VSDPAAALALLKLDRSVPPSPHFVGGSHEGQRRAAAFVAGPLAGYADGRNEPAADRTSHLGAYLHFGQISPVDLALQVSRAKAPQGDRDAYIEELVVRRELSANFVHHCPHYDAYECVPAWARKVLAERAADPRPVVYTLAQLEAAETYDPYWNAAQLEMVRTGFMHNYMRMYWGKKIIEWSPTPEAAYRATLYLNNKYFLCGRNHNAYGNVAWVFGLHDRPWGPARKVFGTVRYMNDAGLRRKFDMAAYVRRVAAL